MFSPSGERKFQVELCRDSLSTPWGFRLEGGSDYGKPLTVQRVVALSAAEGELKPGDHILAVGYKDVTNVAHQEAIDHIASAGARLVLSVLRKPQTQTPALSVSGVANAGPSRISQFRHDDEDDDAKIPQNYQLAKLMTQSLTLTESRKIPAAWTRQANPRSATQLYRHHPMPGQDITAYLPHPGKRQHSTDRRETQLKSQVRDSVLRSPSSSGRSTPSSVLEFGPTTNNAGPSAIGIWTPPAHQPHSKLVHLQYNSPMNLYTPHNVADQVQKTTGTKLSWQKKPHVRFLEDIRDSPTYKYVQKLETPEQSPTGEMESSNHAQSQTMRRIAQLLHEEIEP